MDKKQSPQILRRTTRSLSYSLSLSICRCISCGL